MIPQDRFCNKIVRDLGYTFQRQADRVMVYRKRGSTSRIMVPRKTVLDEEYVRGTLKFAGCTPEEIEKFIAGNRCSN